MVLLSALGEERRHRGDLRGLSTDALTLILRSYEFGPSALDVMLALFSLYPLALPVTHHDSLSGAATGRDWTTETVVLVASSIAVF